MDPFWGTERCALEPKLVSILAAKYCTSGCQDLAPWAPFLDTPWVGSLPPRIKQIALTPSLNLTFAKPSALEVQALSSMLIRCCPMSPRRSGPDRQHIGEPASGRSSPNAVAAMLRTRARSGPKRRATEERALHMHAMTQREQCGNGMVPFDLGPNFGP